MSILDLIDRMDPGNRSGGRPGGGKPEVATGSEEDRGDGEKENSDE